MTYRPFAKSLLAMAVATAPFAAAQQAPATLEETTIIGSQDDAKKVAGSGAFVGAEQIKVENATDINQLLKTVPGVYVREEDGLGLRPNIGIRGATSERTEKITLMEDGVLIAPAPYSNPAAYYFPTASRMKSVEVLKGAPLLRYGPQTTGGVVNLVSTPVPAENAGSFSLSYGENNALDALFNYGGSSDAGNGKVLYLFETAQRRGDGYKTIDRSSKDAGYDVQDYVIKLGYATEKQSLIFKAQNSSEVSEETYLGLTDTDFNANADRRYGLSEIDQMDNEHEGYNLSYKFEISDALTLNATGYHNKFKRDWFKLSGGGDLVAKANGFYEDEYVSAQEQANAQAILDGTLDKDGLKYKHNNRAYASKGVDVNLDIDLVSHDINLGVRSHQDSMDRYQPTEIYNQVDGSLVYVETKDATGSNNRYERADALSFWVTDAWQATENLLVEGTLRYEDIESFRHQYGDAERSAAKAELDKKTNNTEEWLPGLSATYDINNKWQVLAGVHRGFAPLGGGASDNENPETSINYEAGARFTSEGGLFVEAIGFYSDFSNKVEYCSVGSECSNDATSGTFEMGEAVISGLEFQISKDFSAGQLNIPVDFNYTYTQTETKEDTYDGSDLIAVTGDELKDTPENLWSLRTGIETSFNWNNYLVAKYTDEMCVEAGCNRKAEPFAKTDSFLVVDFISRYGITDSSEVFLKVENIADERAIVSRTPDGARPNKPLTLSVGYTMDF